MLGTFSVLFLQVFCEIFIAHTVKIRNTLADQLVFLRVIEKVQSFTKAEMADLSKSLHHSRVFHLKKDRIRTHSFSLPVKCNAC